MLSDNIQFKILKLRAVMDPVSDAKKTIKSGTYAGRQLLSIVEGLLNSTNLKLMMKLLK